MTSDAPDTNQPKLGAALARAWADELDELLRLEREGAIGVVGEHDHARIAFDDALRRGAHSAEEQAAVKALLADAPPTVPADAFLAWLRERG